MVSAGVLPVHARASATSATFRGTLYYRGPLDLPPDAYSGPLDGINVYVDSDPTINHTTGSDGRYTLNNVPPGSQTIIANLAGAGITLITTPYSSDYAGLGMGPGGVGSDETGTSQTLTVVLGTNTLDFRFTIS